MRDLLLIAAIVALVYVGYLIRMVTVPMLLAMLLAYLFEPLVRWLRRRNICSRRTAAIGIIVLFLAVVVVPLAFGTVFAVVHGAQAAGDLAANVTKVQKSIESPQDEALRAAVPQGAWTKIRDFLAESSAKAAGAEPVEGRGELRLLALRIGAWIQEHGADLSRNIGSRVLGGGAQAVGAALGTLASLGFVLFSGLLTAFFFYFFSTGWGRVLEFWESLIPEKRRGRVVQIVAQMDAVIAGFVRGRLIIVFILMIYLTAGYWLIGVPSPYVLGPLVGAMFIVPYVPSLGLVVVVVLLWFNAPVTGLQSHWWWIVGAPLLVHGVAQVLDDYILTPRIQGKTTDLSVPMILFASLAGAALAGVYGLLIAIPTAACLKILMKELLWPRFQAWARGEKADFLPIGKG